MSGGRCATCNHVQAIHDRNGQCPRWAGVRGLVNAGTRVCFRIGHKWPGCEGHVLGYFADSMDVKTAQCLVWDLTTGLQFEAPISTASSRGVAWTRKPTIDQVKDARAELEREIGDRVMTMGKLIL